MFRQKSYYAGHLTPLTAFSILALNLAFESEICETDLMNGVVVAKYVFGLAEMHGITVLILLPPVIPPIRIFRECPPNDTKNCSFKRESI